MIKYKLPRKRTFFRVHRYALGRIFSDEFRELKDAIFGGRKRRNRTNKRSKRSTRSRR